MGLYVASVSRRSAAAPEAHAPTATTATTSPRAIAATVIVLVREPVTAGRLCAGREPVKTPGVCVPPITHNLVQRQNEGEG